MSTGSPAGVAGDLFCTSVDCRLGWVLVARRTGFRAPAPQTVDISTGQAVLEKVSGEPDSYVLHVNGVPSSSITLSDPERLDFEYLDWMARAIAVACPPGPLRAVHIGAAGCALPRHLHARRPGSRQTAIDVDPILLDHVRTWFDLPRSPALALRAGDGATEITTFRPGSLGLIVRDAFAGSLTPPALCTREFFAGCATALSDSGILLCNVADAAGHGPLRAELAVLREVFPELYVIADPGALKGRRWGNVVVLAASAALDLPALDRALRTAPAMARVLTGADLDRFR